MKNNNSKIICTCFGVTQGNIIKLVEEHNIKGIEQITKINKAGKGCKGCRSQIRELIDHTRKELSLDLLEKEKYSQQQTTSMPVIKQIRLITDIIKKHAKSFNADIKFHDLENNVVTIEFKDTNNVKQKEITSRIKQDITKAIAEEITITSLK